MRQLNCWAAVCGNVLCAVLLSGCGSSDVKPPPDVGATAPVTGVVELDGKPVAGVIVSFRPFTAKQYNGATGVTDANGKYELKTDIGDGKPPKPGAPLGWYHVTVSKFVKPDGTSPPQNSTNPNDMKGARESMPMAYTSVNDQYTYEVTTAGGTYDVKMTSSSK
jgi:hypothetical protein